MQTPGARRSWACVSVRTSVSTIPACKKVGKLMVPVFFGMGVFQVNFFVDTIFAALAAHAVRAASLRLYVADRVMELVLGSYAIAISTAILPTMSHQAADGKYDEMKHTFGFSLRVVSFITIPAAVGLDSAARADYAGALSARRVHGRSTALTAHALSFIRWDCRRSPRSS